MAVINTTAALASCNVCGGSQFQPGPLKRLSITERLPSCAGCGSLERHRIARRVMDALPDSLIRDKRVLQLNNDRCVDTTRMAEHRVVECGPRGALDLGAVAIEDGRYDWVVSHHVVNLIEDDVQGLREMLRIVGPRGAVLITVGGTCDRFDTYNFTVATRPYGAFRHYGSDFVGLFYDHVPHASVLELLATDPSTATLDVVFVYSRDIEVLREIGRAVAPSNVYARLTIAPDHDQRAASPTAVASAPAPLPKPQQAGGSSTVRVAEAARDDPRWQPLVDELSEWKRLGRSPRFWVRDDDATRENAKLEALWRQCAANRVTLACSAIPMSMDSSLIEWAKAKTWLLMLQHGFDHGNRAPAGASSSSEFPEERELGDALQAIRKGQELMSSFGASRLPVFVPPWGTIAQQVTARLPELGFSGISMHYLRQAPRQAGIAVTNTHVLLPRLTNRGWSFELELLVSELVATLTSVRARREEDLGEPIGINTHHLSVGETELLALDSLMYITRSCGAEWPDPLDLFGRAS